MLSWKQLRPLLLTFTFGCTLFAVGKATLDPSNGTYTPFVFPTTVSLPGWQSFGSSPLDNHHQEFIAGRRYQYIYLGVPLDIEMSYERSTGDIKAFIQNYTSIPASPTFLYRQQESVGYYVLFIYQKRAYLSSCINPRGASTVTREQFIKNHNTYDLQFSRLFSWILGQEDLRDWRCLWTNMSIPSNHTSVEQSYQVLENAWVLWYKWWSPRFPKV